MQANQEFVLGVYWYDWLRFEVAKQLRPWAMPRSGTADTFAHFRVSWRAQFYSSAYLLNVASVPGRISTPQTSAQQTNALQTDLSRPVISVYYRSYWFWYSVSMDKTGISSADDVVFICRNITHDSKSRPSETGVWRCATYAVPKENSPALTKPVTEKNHLRDRSIFTHSRHSQYGIFNFPLKHCPLPGKKA